MGIIDDVLGGQVCDPFDDVSELTNVAGPIMRAEPFFCGCGQLRFASSYFVAERGEKVIGQLQYIFTAGTQWRSLDRYDCESEIKVFAKLLVSDKFDEILIGSSNDSYVYWDGR